ncbi:MAG: FUSC family protein, partial [Actinomycetota bacterium]|nr:FUSC family protein [Actinomycetota bacterium]
MTSTRGVRARLDAARVRVRDSTWSVGQCALAAGVAWYAATTLLGHPRPFLACVAAVVCLGVRAGQRLRRVGELAVGVTVGVAVGDLLVGQIGTGVWQISLVVGVALLLAVALDGGPLIVAQAGLQAVFVLALPREPGGDLARWEDALVGG